MNWFKRKNKTGINPSNLDWGLVTADLDNEKETIHVFNSDMTKKENENLTKSFVINKYSHYKNHLPSNRKQIFVFDLRGQSIHKKESEKIEEDIRIEIKKIDANSDVKFEFKL